MSTKDVSDEMVCRAFMLAESAGRWPYELLAEWTGEPGKVCFRAMERAERRGLVECGVSLRAGWLTEKGKALTGGIS